MSIKEDQGKSNPSGEPPLSNDEVLEEEFDLVPTSQKNPTNKHILAGILIILVGTASFGLGRLSSLNKEKKPIEILNTLDQSSTIETVAPVGSTKTETKEEVLGASVQAEDTNQTVVGSKNGSKYHLPSCPGAKQIADKNKIVFSSPEEARKAGYTPAANCKGLK